MAGAFVAQTRTTFVALFVPRPSGAGTDASLTNSVPPSPCELALTTSAAPSFWRNDRYLALDGRPLCPPRSSGAAAVRVAFVAGGSSEKPEPPPPLASDPVRILLNPFDSAPKVRGGPAFARRKRLVSLTRLANGSNRALTSRGGVASTMAPLSLPLYFSRSLLVFTLK